MPTYCAKVRFMASDPETAEMMLRTVQQGSPWAFQWDKPVVSQQDSQDEGGER